MTRSKYGPDWPKFADMTFLKLVEGPANLTEIDVAPTMKQVLVGRERYFRMEDTRTTRPDGSFGGMYLWDGWGPRRRQEHGIGEAP